MKIYMQVDHFGRGTINGIINRYRWKYVVVDDSGNSWVADYPTFFLNNKDWDDEMLERILASDYDDISDDMAGWIQKYSWRFVDPLGKVVIPMGNTSINLAS